VLVLHSEVERDALTLSQDAQSLSGTFTSDIVPQELPVAGTVDADHVTLHLAGDMSFGQNPCGGSHARYQLSNWTSVVDAAGAAMTGTLRQSASAYYFSCYWGTIDFDTAIASLTKGASP
jgi:hypothetical protein